MTVKQLIENLQALDQDIEVYIAISSDCKSPMADLAVSEGAVSDANIYVIHTNFASCHDCLDADKFPCKCNVVF